jgi:hypothetical protein
MNDGTLSTHEKDICDNKDEPQENWLNEKSKAQKDKCTTISLAPGIEEGNS